ncbi:FecCD family ABC transporter permease [Streptomyces sp. NBC_01237]|uniref:FecCD family ABC transporter permease n=1 Tax=Streptomyces sp. NBC_01237 TaxID=2903790 RepID=UPI002DD85580|nr:iron chelate uptake ABC transporter family permease subunit [Streptomyces sp. NBC_01237]WRZ78050.1 iron chelate uptake ABC transporter family permease subunit [Streptomyces sp. NBC_01237]
MTGPTTTVPTTTAPGARRSRGRRRHRAAGTTLTLTLLGAAVLIASLAAGDISVPVPDVLHALAGRGDPLTSTVVLTWRLPRALLALALGAALGLSGAIFQTLTRNPLGSPDVIGFNTGASTGALAVLLSGTAGYTRTALGALIGGLATAALVYALGGRRSTATTRFVVTGIAVSAILTSVNTWLMYGADTAVAARAAQWTAGSLDALGWEHAVPALVALAPLALITPFLVRTLRVLELGDDVATALGARVVRGRLILATVGVALTAVATSVAGPLAFVALAAPQIARLLYRRTPGISLPGAALTGALLLAGADWVAAHAFAPVQLPTGVVTVSTGGAYLLWLLLGPRRGGRKG